MYTTILSFTCQYYKKKKSTFILIQKIQLISELILLSLRIVIISTVRASFLKPLCIFSLRSNETSDIKCQFIYHKFVKSLERDSIIFKILTNICKSLQHSASPKPFSFPPQLLEKGKNIALHNGHSLRLIFIKCLMRK